jgi:hypothetical protein
VRSDTGSSARKYRAFSRNLEAEPDAMADPFRSFQKSRNLEAAGDLLTDGGVGPHPRSRGLRDQTT